ncbi:integrase arm-type DNA-binding domain-containing protein [Mesorhizobium sp. CAU 1741]|uniref:tyrosine-type recombinase/integrase n=1 Tax=Mesorhizobium sp. CAU 1741 TaxID=3140366 RepID=UPI00325AEAF1
MPLTDVFCRTVKAAEKPQKFSDGGGLFLLVEPRGSKLWRLAYRFDGKQKTLSFGVYPTIGLKEAREQRDRARELLARDIDPGEHKKQLKRRKRLEAENTFETVAREWFDGQKSGWTQGYSDRILRRLEADVFREIGRRPINDIEPPELLETIRKIEKRNAVVLARRLLQVCGQVFRYAVASGLAKRDPSQDIRGALRSAGPKKRRTALKEAEIPEFLSALDAYEGDRRTVLALKLVMHTFLRTSEIRFGVWSELEALGTERALWRIPAERMKARSEHLVPITPQVELILEELKRLSGDSPYLLPAKTKEGVISQNTLIYALYRMGYHSRATVHGFRGTASTILNEHGFNRDWIERQLAHAERDGVRAAYNSAEWLPDRRNMLLWWSMHLENLNNGGLRDG